MIQLLYLGVFVSSWQNCREKCALEPHLSRNVKSMHVDRGSWVLLRDGVIDLATVHCRSPAFGQRLVPLKPPNSLLALVPMKMMPVLGMNRNGVE